MDKSAVIQREQKYFDTARDEQERSLAETDHSAESAGMARRPAPCGARRSTVVNAVDSLREFKPRFEREILPSEVPALGGQVTFDV